MGVKRTLQQESQMILVFFQLKKTSSMAHYNVVFKDLPKLNAKNLHLSYRETPHWTDFCIWKVIYRLWYLYGLGTLWGSVVEKLSSADIYWFSQNEVQLKNFLQKKFCVSLDFMEKTIMIAPASCALLCLVSKIA